MNGWDATGHVCTIDEDGYCDECGYTWPDDVLIIPTSPPEPTTLAWPTHCCRCGTETPAGEDVYVRGGETECWGECHAPA